MSGPAGRGRSAVVGLLALATVGLAACGSGSGSMQRAAPVRTQAVPQSILDQVSGESSSDGGPVHGTAEYVTSTRDDVLQALQMGSMPDQQPVWVFLVRGSFVDRKSFGPAGSPDPTGNAMTLTFSRDADPKPLDFGLQNTPPDLSVLGPVHTVHF